MRTASHRPQGCNFRGGRPVVARVQRMSRRGPRILRALTPPAWAGVLALAALACWVCALAPVGASARSLHFDGRQVTAPGSWPVYRLAEHPRMCVRLDRRAVYLGTPGAN